MSTQHLADLLKAAIHARKELFDPDHRAALRVFHGFLEGAPELAIDIYARTAVLHDYTEKACAGTAQIETAMDVLRDQLPWLRCAVLKARHAEDPSPRRGQLLLGDQPDDTILEHGVAYALDLMMNRDASLYLDTRNLRRWALEKLREKSVLNTFAYTGSLGVAAAAGRANNVVQLDRTRRFLDLAQRSFRLNHLDEQHHELLIGDFFAHVARLKRSGRRFDCVFLDPPFFATSARGVVDLETNSTRLINKVRPLVEDGGWLVVVNNALFVSGRQFMDTLEQLCHDGYLSIDELIPVPADFTGYPGTRIQNPVTDPEPFNHSTKIAVLRVTRKG